jgi:coronin-1B/1C/6
MAFVRSSKFRHVFGTAARKDGCFEGFRVTNCAFEGNFIAANGKFVAACVEVGGGGAFIVLPIDKVGRLDPNQPKVSAHKEYVLDLEWNPYDDTMLASCSEDGSIRIWQFPEYGVLTNIDSGNSAMLLSLDTHEKRCVQVAWHPSASNVLLSVSQEPKVCLWNLDDGVVELDIEGEHPDIIWNASWSSKGDKIVTACKDKKFRIFDARTGTKLLECEGHEGAKAQRVVFCHKDECLFSTGFSRMSERQYALWHIQMGDSISNSTLNRLDLQELDTANGALIPYYDADTLMVYIAAKGDSTIRYYELDADYLNANVPIHYITTFNEKSPQRGIAPIPKRSVNVNICEIGRFYKLLQDKQNGVIEPISMTVPRKSETFQNDLYPDAIGPTAAIEASEFFEGSDAEPLRISMEQFYEQKTKNKSTGGGLKKGGLKGLKAKKDAKDATKKEPAKPAAAPVKKAETAPPPPKPEPVKPSAPPEPKPAEEEEKRESLVKLRPVSGVPASSSNSAPAAPSSNIDAKELKEMKQEIQSLKDNEKKMQKEMKSLTDKLKDYDKLAADIKLLCDAVKKNDERIAALEALVQEESDEEGGNAEEGEE